MLTNKLMSIRATLFFALLSLVTLHANAVELLAWTPTPESPIYLIPRQKSETPQQALEHFLMTIQSDPAFSIFYEGVQIPQQVHKLEDFEFQDNKSKPDVLLLANWGSDLSLLENRMTRNYRLFQSAGGNTYVLPLGATARLSRREQQSFNQKITQAIDLLVALGGDDVAPQLYGRANLYSRKTHLRRDQLEFELIKSYKQSERGFFFGICRGHQLGAVADGHLLFQDLTQTGIAETEMHINPAAQNLTEMQKWHKIKIISSFLKDILKSEKILVNSVHHQAVKVIENAHSVPIAFDGNVVEALEQKNGRGLSLQFHAEFPYEISGNKEFSEMGRKIISHIVHLSFEKRHTHGPLMSCRKIFSP